MKKNIFSIKNITNIFVGSIERNPIGHYLYRVLLSVEGPSKSIESIQNVKNSYINYQNNHGFGAKYYHFLTKNEAKRFSSLVKNKNICPDCSDTNECLSPLKK